jgi:DNA-binding GntR family transcriptional regulator
MSIADYPFAPLGGAEDRAMAIREQLREAIIDRRLAPGTKLGEAEVGALFDVSRTVVRSALQMLSFEGLVRSERNRGSFVANPSPEEARQVFDSRRLIEPALAAAAIERIGPADVARFRELLAEEDRLMGQRGTSVRRAEIRASGDFHLELARVAGNAVLERFMEELVARSSLVSIQRKAPAKLLAARVAQAIVTVKTSPSLFVPITPVTKLLLRSIFFR